MCEPVCNAVTPDCPEVCVAQCECDQGFIRDKNGICIAWEECNKNNACFEDEIWDDLTQACVKWITCGSNEYFDDGKCLCFDGFIREFGVCVVDHGCTRNETWNECASPCEEVCGNENPEFCAEVCNPTCECNDGYVRHPDGNCVKVNECKLCPGDKIWDELYRFCRKECQENEVYDGAKCVCDDGYTEFGGICIKELKCGKFEYFNGCGSKCEPVCGQKDFPICSTVCGEPTCDCIDGYIRDIDGSCIPEENCITCDDNEYLDDNSGKCMCLPGYRRDEDSGRCRALPSCSENEELFDWTCVCKDGYIRDNDRCIIKCGRHEEVENGKCQCIEGYYLNRFGFCQKLPEDEKCHENEEWNECASPCEITCGIASPEFCPEICISKCVCKKGYFRSIDGMCIKDVECKPGNPECGPNEELFEDNEKNLQMCKCIDDYFRNDFGVCQLIPEKPAKCPHVNEERHEGECKCKKGYKRNKYGVCCIACNSCCDTCNNAPHKNNIANINFAPQNHNDQNFININTEVENDVDMNLDFNIDAVFNDIFDGLF